MANKDYAILSWIPEYCPFYLLTEWC